MAADPNEIVQQAVDTAIGDAVGKALGVSAYTRHPLRPEKEEIDLD